MSRTIGHTGDRFRGMKRDTKMQSKRNLRASNRALVSSVLSGMTDWDNALWLTRPREMVNYWSIW